MTIYRILRRLAPAVAALFAAAVAAADPAALYQQHCAACHGPGRLGLTGPALLPESLARLKKPEAAKVIAEGRVATQMLGFADRMNKEEIAALSDYIYTAVSPAPTFAAASTSRIYRSAVSCRLSSLNFRSTANRISLYF